MESCINWVIAMIGEGYTPPTQIRVAEPYQTALRDSEVFSGDSPLLPDPSILTGANSGDESLVVLVYDGEDYRAVLGM